MGIITDILKEIPLSAVLRERLVDQEKKMAALETENNNLKSAIKKLETIIKQYEKLNQADEKEDFTIAELFPHKPDVPPSEKIKTK